MADLELSWLIPTILQVVGLAIAIAIFGFVLENAAKAGKPLIEVLEDHQKLIWLAIAGSIFVAGICFTEIIWVYKLISIVLAILLIGLAWTSPHKIPVDRSTISESNQTKTSVK